MLDPIPAYYAQKFAAAPSDALHALFTPDYTPEQLERLGVYDALYRGKSPRLASLGEWKPEWISEHDPKGWAQWYKRYASGRRIPDEDDRQIKRWLSFKARHGGPFSKNPTPRRGWALRNWGIDPSKLVPDQAQQVNELLDEHQRKAMQKFVKEKVAVARWREAGNLVKIVGQPNLAFGAPRRLEVLQQAAKKLNLAAVPGQAYQKFIQSLRWRPVPARVINAIENVPATLDAPRYLFRGITPHSNIRQPFLDRGELKSFLHGTPNFDTAQDYARSIAPGDSSLKTFQVFKPTAQQAYVPDWQLDVTNGAGWPSSGWSNVVADIQKKMRAPLEHPLAMPPKPSTLVRQRAYETPITSDNKALGTFLTRLAPHPDENIGGFVHEFAKIPAAQKTHAEGLAREWAKTIGEDSVPYRGPDEALRRTYANGERTQWGRPPLAKTAELLPELSLQPHQQRVSDRISGDDPRLLVYHGLGSGKSLSAIAAAEAAKKVHGGNYGVVVPASLRGNFQKELKKFTTGSNPEILSYSGLALGKKFKQPPETVVMDEAQRLRNPGAAATQSAEEVARQAKRLVLLSGTPITNSPTDLASLMSLLDNKPMSPQDFEKRYIGYRKKFPGVIPWLRGAQWGEEPYVRNEKELRERLKGKVDYQPSKTPQGVTVNEETIKVPLSAEQAKIQKAIRTQIPPGFLWKLDKEFPLSRDELKKLNSFLTGLRQVSLSTQPFRVDKDPLKAFDQSSKLREAMKRLRENLDSDPRRKAIVYSNFIDSGVNPYAKALEREKIPYGIFHGGIPVKARQEALKNYNEGKLRALLLGPAAAEGISTKGTSLIQLLDPYWHESRTQQARGRGLRFDSHEGLPEELKNVAVQRFLSASEEPGLFSKYVLGKRRQRTGDEVLQHLSDNKERLNEAFRKILRDVGAEKHKPKPADENTTR